MWQRFLGIEAQRRRALKHLDDNPLRRYLSHPFADGAQSCRDTGIIALDLETTGLDDDSDHILSIGLVAIDKLSIRLDSAWHQLVRSGVDIPEASAVIHGITDDRARQGLPLKTVLPVLLQRLAGHAVLVHHAAIEQNFLSRACQRLYGGPFIAPIIDTEQLARRRFERRQRPYQPRDLRLFNLRRQYHLPRYGAHNALSDALATAELLLALVAESHAGMNCRLNELLSP